MTIARRIPDSDNIWVYMGVQSLSPADGGPPLPEDLIVRLKGGDSGTATQELHAPRDGYGYHGDAELYDLAIIINSSLVVDDDDTMGGRSGGQPPKVQAVVELWQGEYQLWDAWGSVSALHTHALGMVLDE